MNRLMNRSGSRTLRRSLPALLLALVAWGVVQAQEGERGTAGRGDRHSAGWQRVLRLKGTPVPPKFPKVGKEIERVVLENGLVVYLLEDHRLPLLDAVVLVRTGTFYEPAEEIGTASLAGQLLQTGGTKTFPPEKLEERLDFIAANLSVSMRGEECSLSLNVPQKDAGEGLEILADVLRHPLFEESRLELAKRQTIFSLRASNDTPGQILRREFSRLLYTESHPSGRTPTVAQISQIGREDLVRFHQNYFHPNQMMLGLTGDFNKTEMLAKVRELFGDWPQADAGLPPLPKVNPQPKPGVFYVPKAVNQSSIRLGHWGTNRDNPDRFALDLMNEILGGSSFSSRMGERVRNDEGLAYSVGTGFATSQRDVGLFLAAADTKTESTVRAMESMLDVIQKMRTEEVSKNEFDTAQEVFLYSYVFRFAEPARSLAALMRLEYEDLPADYLEKEFAGYQAVTPQDIARVARQYLQPEQLTLFIVGDYPKFAQDVVRLGQPREIQPLRFDAERGPTEAR